MRLPKIVEQDEDGNNFVRDKEDKKYQLICPKCKWPLEFHLKTGRKSQAVWDCTNPFCRYKEWRVGLKSWKPNFLQVELLSICVVSQSELKDDGNTGPFSLEATE
jgi:hypothetical protein